MNGKTTDELPRPYATLVIELANGKRVFSYHVPGSDYWLPVWRRDDGTYIDPKQIKSWYYLTHEEQP